MEEKDDVLNFVGQDTMEGFEGIKGDTMAVPFVRILQPLSPQLNEAAPEHVEGAKAGLLFNTAKRELYGAEMEVIPLRFERIFIEWRPNREGFAGYHTPENAERITVSKAFGDWKTSEGNLLQENYVYMLLVVGYEKEGPVVLSLASSMIKAAKEWNRQLITHIMADGRRALPYYLVYNVSTEMKRNEKGMWWVPVIRFARYINKEQYETIVQERKALPARQVDYAQIEHAKGDEAVAAADSAGF